jgi:lipoprotein-releasing system ATP-binding protein
MSDNFPIYQLHNVIKEVKGPKETITILHNLKVEIKKRESVAILGASGSGKTTLLYLLGGLDSPTSGTILFKDEDISNYSWGEKASFRNKNIGFIFQFHHLLLEFNTIENVAMPALIAGESKKSAFDRAYELLQLVGLQEQSFHSVSTLSGGERQLTAISRALMNQPQVVLADEPTGDLDRGSGQKVGEILLEVNDQLGTTLIVATHNIELAKTMQRNLHLYNGDLYESEAIDTTI